MMGTNKPYFIVIVPLALFISHSSLLRIAELFPAFPGEYILADKLEPWDELIIKYTLALDCACRFE
jgi:hypothetical protein